MTTTALADTGCQSCLAGPTLMKSLLLQEQDLIPTALAMKSASGNDLPIMGAALIRLKSPASCRETRQMVYFSQIATKLYLSLATWGSSTRTSHSHPSRTRAESGRRKPSRGHSRNPSLHRHRHNQSHRSGTDRLQQRHPLIGPANAPPEVHPHRNPPRCPSRQPQRTGRNWRTTYAPRMQVVPSMYASTSRSR